MQQRCLIVAVCVVLCMLVDRLQLVEAINGEFRDGKGNMCKYWENRYNGGKGPRGMVISCGNHYECTYKGNPHGCGWYNNNHQPEFYECLAKDAKKAEKGACGKKSIACPKKCKNVEMIKQKGALLFDLVYGSFIYDDY